MKKLSDVKWDELISKYQNSGLSAMDLGIQYGVSQSAVYFQLKKRGIEKKMVARRRSWSIDTIKGLIEAGKSNDEIASQLKISTTTLWELLKKNSLVGYQKATQDATWKPIIEDYISKELSVEQVLEKHGVSRTGLWLQLQKNNIVADHNRKIFFDEEIFENPTPELAYHMGFGLADGNLYIDPRDGWPYYQVHISEKDKCVLDDLIRVLKIKAMPGHEIITRQEGEWRFFERGGKDYWAGPRCKIRLAHKKFPQWLEPWGIIPKKTYNYSEPRVPQAFLAPFIIGLIDGDGWQTHSYSEISTQEDHKIGLCGNLKLLCWVENKLREMGFSGWICTVKRNEWWGKIEISSEESIYQLHSILKPENGFRLRRKWETSIKLFGTTNDPLYA